MSGSGRRTADGGVKEVLGRIAWPRRNAVADAKAYKCRLGAADVTIKRAERGGEMPA